MEAERRDREVQLTKLRSDPPRTALCLPLVRTRRPAHRPRPHRAVRPEDEGRLPGQTHPGNLAPLCRRHHRAKTFTGWHYERARGGTYSWTSLHGHTWTVGPDGTSRTTGPAPADRAAAYTLAT